MSADLQQILALVVVGGAAIGLLLRQVKRRKHPGCGGECACPAEKLRK